MRCEYCGVEVTEYPANGICVCCGGKLPERPAGIRCPKCGAFSSGKFCASCGRSLTGTEPAPAPVQPVYIPVQNTPLHAGANCCPKCHSTRILYKPRGFSWGWALLGFFFLPPFGLLFGLCGRKKPRASCLSCNHKWKPN